MDTAVKDNVAWARVELLEIENKCERYSRRYKSAGLTGIVLSGLCNWMDG